MFSTSEPLETHAIAPQLFGLSQVFRTRQSFPIGDVTVVVFELKLLRRDQIGDVFDLLAQSNDETVENNIRRGRIAASACHVIKARAPLFKLSHVRLEKKQMRGVERIQILVKKFRRDLVVKPLLKVMAPFQYVHGDLGDALVIGTWFKRLPFECVGVLLADEWLSGRILTEAERGDEQSADKC